MCYPIKKELLLMSYMPYMLVLCADGWSSFSFPR